MGYHLAERLLKSDDTSIYFTYEESFHGADDVERSRERMASFAVSLTIIKWDERTISVPSPLGLCKTTD